jgi:alkaline phosphatase D
MIMNRWERSSTYGAPTGRRNFLAGAGALAGLALTGQLAEGWAAEKSGRFASLWPKFSTDPFTLGIASGDPLPDGVVLWTRLAPDPLNGGGMPPNRVAVEWEIATDDQMQKVVQRGTAWATPALGHSVHVEARGLQPARWYWYRFKTGAALSPIGRTRTAPAVGARPDQFAFAFASCQHYEQGYFTAYQHLAAEDLELVVHLGDYIYEGDARSDRPRRHNGLEPITLVDYRNRYALYKSDPHLQLAHATFPWIMTWDDHEVENNYAGATDENNGPPQVFLARRAQAYQAYYEHMPLRRSSLPRGPHLQLYRRLKFGRLAEFTVLDTRQYRTDQPCDDGFKARCAEVLDPKATLTGPQQERWLLDGLARSQARWNVIAQQVVMAEYSREVESELRYNMDAWTGYPAARNRILGFLHRRRPSNPVVLTGDVHTNWVADLKADFDNPRSATVGAEFVGTSISSGGDGTDTRPEVAARLPALPHIKFFNAQRGYVRCRLTPDRWQTDYRIVPVVTKPDAPITTRASFVVENGKPGVERA